MKRVLNFLTVCALCFMLNAFWSGNAMASGYALIEQSVTGLGNAFAGGAAVAEDATTIYFNPSGMTRLRGQQFISGVHMVAPTAKFKNEGSTHVLEQRTGMPLQGGNGGDGGAVGFVPNLYLVKNFSDKFFIGLGVNSPFGLATKYKDTWVGRYHAIDSDLKTVNINPSFAYRITDKFIIGGGLNLQYAGAKLSNAIDFGTLDATGFFAPLGMTPGALGLVPQGADGFASLEGDSWGFGFNAGVLFEPAKNTRIGAAYRSGVHHVLEGEAEFSSVPAGLSSAPLFKNSDIEASMDMPDSASLSIAHEYLNGITVMADITWTNWSVFDELRIKFDNPFQPDTVITTRWDDSFRYSVGISYSPGTPWTLRSGFAFDKTPIPGAGYRTPRIPDGDRFWTALGFGYRFSGLVCIDAGYAHLFFDDPAIEKTPTGEDAVRGGLNGTYNTNVDILGAQLTLQF